MSNSPFFSFGYKKFKFDTDFRNGCYLEEEVYNNALTDEEVVDIVECVLGTKNLDAVNEFMMCGEKPTSRNIPKRENSICDEYEQVIPTRPYSYNIDWQYIVSAFQELYDIDLIKSHMHYWKFKALFNNIHDTRLNEVMEIRTKKLSDITDSKERAYYMKQQEIYKLPTKKDKMMEDAKASFDSLFE